MADAWGTRATIRAGLGARDALREAIQALSPEVRERHVYTHTGWRQIDARWVYLTAAGAIGAADIEVALDGALQRYWVPTVPDDACGALRTSLALWRVAPLTVTVPLWAAVFRAPLAHALPVDLSLWLVGRSGTRKSTVAALFLAHYGSTFDRVHLPDAWSSTANALERRAFLLKDVVFVVDEYVPRKAGDPREMETKAERLVRAQGNRSGRARLRPDLTLRPDMPPRGLLVATGEESPSGQGVLARLVLLPFDDATVAVSALTGAQQATDRLPHALSGYLGWLAPQMGTLAADLRAVFFATRKEATREGQHLRIPEAVAHCWLGIELGLRYATAIGACSAAEADALRTEAWAALGDVARGQARLVETERPSRRFLRVLLALITQGRGVLLVKDGPLPFRSSAEMLGWQDDEALYFLPDASYRAVARFCQDAGEPFPVRERRLRDDLMREGLIEHDQDGHTGASVWIEGQKRRVLWFQRDVVERVLGEPFPVPPSDTIPPIGNHVQ